MDSSNEIIFFILCCFYIFNVLMFYYLSVEKIRIIDMIILSKNPRKRQEIEAAKKDIKKDFILCFFWPLIFLRELINGRKKNK